MYPKLKIKMILSVCFPEGTDELNTQCLEIKNIVSNHSIDLRDGKSVEEHEVVFPGEVN